MNRFQQRAAQVPAPVTWLIMLSACALGAYWWFNYSGLYRLLAEMQLQSFQSYYPTYTGLIALFLCLIPAALVIQFIGGLRERERSPAEAATQAAAHEQRSARVSAWIEQRRRRLTGLALTVGLAGAGVYFSGSALLAGARVSVDAGALERGERPPGRFVELTGRLVADDAVSVTEGSRSSSERIYVPVVSPEWQPGQPVRAYLKMFESSLQRRADDLATGHHEGMLTANSLPGVAITSFAERGHPAPDRYWVLDYGSTPKTQMDLGYAMFFAAGLIGIITAIGWAIAARREKARGRFLV